MLALSYVMNGTVLNDKKEGVMPDQKTMHFVEGGLHYRG